MKLLDNIKTHIREFNVKPLPDMQDRVLNKAIKIHHCKHNHLGNRGSNIWGKIMNNKTFKISSMVVIILLMLLLPVFQSKTSVVSAAEVLREAIDKVSGIYSVHMKARMRTLPGDNFALINTSLDFIPMEMWKVTNSDGTIRWRVEKEGRILVMDGQTTTMDIRGSYVREDRPLPQGCFDSWMGRLLNVSELLESELKRAESSGSKISTKIETMGGHDCVILKAEIMAGVAKDDYLYNKFLSSSNHLKVYQFNADTKLLEAFQIFVCNEEDNILVFEITDINYNIDLDDSLFNVDIPKDASVFGEVSVMPDNEKYEAMTPKETATLFFQSMSNENWDEVLKFMRISELDANFKNTYGGIEIVSIGEPFQSQGYASPGKGWFVPYEIRFKPVENHSLLSNQNSAKRFVVIDWGGKKMSWDKEPAILENNDIYAEMAAQQALLAYYESLRCLDFEEMKKFISAEFVDEMKKGCDMARQYGMTEDDLKSQMPVIEIIDSKWSDEKNAYVVKYFESRTKKMNLAIRKDNEANRFVVDGGF